MSVKAVGSIIGQTLQRFTEERAHHLGAALAFYTMISLTPLLLVLVGVAGQVFGAEAARGEIVAQIEGAVGQEAAVLIENALRQAGEEEGGRTATLLGVLGLIVGATTVFAQLKMALNAIWGVEPPRGLGFVGSVKNFLVTRVLVFAVLLGIGFLLLVSLVSSAMISAAAAYFNEFLPLPAGTLRLLNMGLSLVIITFVFAYLYRAVPDVRIRWNDVWVGAVVTAVLFTVGKELIGLYLGQSSVGSAYGAAGSLVVLLVWLYYSAQIFFLGAVLTRVYALHSGAEWSTRRGFRIVRSRNREETGT